MSLIYDMPSEQYHADPCPEPSLSASLCKILLGRSPLHAWAAHPKLGNAPKEKGEDDKFDYGSAAHDVLLEGGKALAVLNPEDYRSKPTKADPEGSVPKGWTNGAIRAAREEARASGKVPVLPPQANRIMKMTEAANKFIDKSPIVDFWRMGKSEVTYAWREHGIWLRCRFDRLSDDLSFIGDYKSTVSANPEWFSRHIPRMGYHLQEAFYRRAIRSMGKPDPKFTFLAQEVTAPFACSLHECDGDLQAIADAQVEHAILLWAQCLAENKWPAYGYEVNQTKPTAWMMEQAVSDGTFDLGYRETAEHE